MSTKQNARIYHAAGDRGDLIVNTVSRSRHAKRRQEEADTCDGAARTCSQGVPLGQCSRLANAKEERKAQEGGETPKTPLATEKIMHLLKDLWNDDKCVIARTLNEIASIAYGNASWDEENEVKMRELGGLTAVIQVLQKHAGCLAIQKEGMRALANFCRFKPTKRLLGEIGCVEVIFASIETYPDSETIQWYGCTAVANLVWLMKDNAELVEKSGGIAVVNCRD